MKTLSREGIQRMTNGQGASPGGGGGIQSLAGYATQAWTEENYLSKPYFNQLFTVHTQITTTVVDDQGEPVGDPVITYGTLAPNALPGTTETTDEETGYVTTVATVITSIEAKFGFWSQSFISALGQGQGGGGGGASALTDLVDVAISSVENGQVLMYDSTLSKWVNGTVQSGGGDYLPLTGGTMANTNLVTNMNADLLDGLNGADYLSRHNVDNDYDTTPGQKIITVSTGSTIVSENRYGSLIQWGNSNKTPGTADNNTWYNQLIGMTNNCLYFRTRTNGGEWTTVKKIAFISDFSSWALASTKPSYAFSELTSHPTTLSGYGITDAKIENGTITLGSNSITPLTASSNAASATKLQTARTIWGQSFDGTANIDGTLTFGSGYGIQYSGVGMLIYKPTDGWWTAISDTQWGVGASDAQGVIRTNNNDLQHYRSGSGTYDIITTYHHPSRSYTFTSNTEYTAKWHRLGNYKTAGNASNFAIMLYTGSGYNANASQNSFARIVVKDGWQQTPAATNSVGVTVERFGNFDISHEIKAVVVATSDREGALWVYLPWQYADGDYTISGVYDSWTHNSGYTDDTTTEPTSNQHDTGYFDIVYNKTYPQFSNLRLRNGTDYYGSYLYFGDGSNAFICEPTDDSLQYKVGANKAHVFTVGNSNKVEVNSNGLSTGNLTMTGYIDGATNIELNPSTNSAGNGGYIDFHYNQSSSDYTSRIIEDASGRLYLVASNGIRIGDCVIAWDSTNNALKVQKADGTAANLYATGGVSALGLSGGSGGSIGTLTVTSRLNIGNTDCNLQQDSGGDFHINCNNYLYLGSSLSYIDSDGWMTATGLHAKVNNSTYFLATEDGIDFFSSAAGYHPIRIYYNGSWRTLNMQAAINAGLFS